jgi:hypothetical protein
MRNVRRFLSNKGKVVVCVPNVDSLVAQSLGKDCFTFCPQHLWYFNKSRLRDILKYNRFNPTVAWTIEPESTPILKKTAMIEPYADNLPDWLFDQIMSIELPDIIQNGLGYKIVMMGEAI